MTIDPKVAPVARDVFNALPLLVKRELVTSRGSDKIADLALSAVADKGLEGKLRDDFALGFIREARKLSGVGAWAIGREIPMNLAPFLPGYEGFGDAVDPQGGPSPRTARPVARLPYSLYAQTTLTTGNGVNTNADPQSYINGEQYEFVVTHVTVSEGIEPIVFNPQFLMQFSFAQNGKLWMRSLQNALSFLTYTGTAQSPAAVNASNLSRWKLSAPYLLNRYGSLYAEASNLTTAENMTVQLAYVAFKRDGMATPRIFSSTVTVNANTLGTPFNTSNFRNDGDADADVTEVLISGGSGRWGSGANPSAPVILIRPDGNTGSTKGWTGNGQNGALATALNNTPVGLGPYWELAVPQRVAPGTNIQITFQNYTGSAILANVGFIGYLEVRQ